MKIANEEIARKFEQIADLLEIEGANRFRVRAYRNAARSITSFTKNIADMVKAEEKLTMIPGVGKDLAEKIREIVNSGDFALLKQTEKKLPPLLRELMTIEGLGPKRVKQLFDKLHIESIDDLKRAIERGALLTLRGFGKIMVQRISEGIAHHAEYAKSTRLADAYTIVDLLLKHMRADVRIERVDVAGSFRRKREVIGDLDLLACGKNDAEAIKHFLQFDRVEKVTAKGPKRTAVRLANGLQVDFRVVPKAAYGAALLYFTGSKDHNVALRTRALEQGFKLNEYGLFRGAKTVAGKTEKDIYNAIGLRFIEPELRECQGEIDAALNGQLPKLIERDDLRGDLHVHTNETDGTESMLAMAEAARDRGYEYVAITDHSQRLTVANGLDEKRLRAQIDAINKLNTRIKGITILKGIEVDILENGRLDLPDSVLKELDFTVCSIHSRFNLDENRQTERIIKAMDHPCFTILGHPTGRLINRRQAYPVDMARVMDAAVARGCFLELNGQPERLDVNDRYCRMAKERGLKLSIASDAHSSKQLDFVQFGIFQARRGWLEKNDVINTRPLSSLRKLLKR